MTSQLIPRSTIEALAGMIRRERSAFDYAERIGLAIVRSSWIEDHIPHFRQIAVMDAARRLADKHEEAAHA